MDEKEYTLFVLDFDGTYDHENPDGLGVCPVVYLIGREEQIGVEDCAKRASRRFAEETESSDCIGDYFERFMREDGYFFQEIGMLRLPYKDRQTDYLADYIPREIV